MAILSLSIAKINTASETVTCAYIEDEKNRYTCKMESLDFANENDDIEIADEGHSNTKTDLDVENLIISSSAIHHIPKAIFTKFTRLRVLQVENVGLKKVIEGNFFNCADLDVLKLGNNKLEGIPKKAFEDCSKITEIDLTKNEISEVDDEAFSGLTNLKVLNLEENALDKAK